MDLVAREVGVPQQPPPILGLDLGLRLRRGRGLIDSRAVVLSSIAICLQTRHPEPRELRIELRVLHADLRVIHVDLSRGGSGRDVVRHDPPRPLCMIPGLESPP